MLEDGGYILIALAAVLGLLGRVLAFRLVGAVVIPLALGGVALELAKLGAASAIDLTTGPRASLHIRLASFAVGSLMLSAATIRIGHWLERRRADRSGQSPAATSALEPRATIRLALVAVSALVLAFGLLNAAPAGSGVQWWGAWACALLGAIMASICTHERADRWPFVQPLMLLVCLATAFSVFSGLTNPYLGLLGVALAGIGALALSPGTPDLRPDHRVRTLPAILASVCCAIALLGGTLSFASRGLAHQAHAYLRQHPIAPPEGAAISAVVIAPETFAIVIPGKGEEGGDLIRAGVVLDRSQFATPDEVRHLEPGMTMRAEPLSGDLDAHGFQLRARIAHGDHFHSFNFQILSISKASLRELCTAFDALDASPTFIAGTLLGVLGTMPRSRRALQPSARPRTLAESLVPVALLMAIALALGPSTCMGAMLGALITTAISSALAGTNVLAAKSDPSDSNEPDLAGWCSLAAAISPFAARFAFIHPWM
jgi:hypothetical protein